MARDKAYQGFLFSFEGTGCLTKMSNYWTVGMEVDSFTLNAGCGFIIVESDPLRANLSASSLPYSNAFHEFPIGEEN